MSTILTYQADINGGHYALHTVIAGATEAIAVNAASYNNVEIRPERIYVGNYANPANVTITLQGGLQTIVPAYTNNYVTVEGYPTITIQNPGVENVQILAVDEKMIDFAEDTFATLTVAGASSNNDILNHFNGTLSQNEGYLEGVVYTVGSGVNFSGNKKFGETAANFKSGNAGVKIYKSDYFDFSDDFCIDFWLYIPAFSAQYVIAEIGADDSTLVQQIMRLHVAATSGTLRYYNKNTAPNSGGAMTVATYQHIAITKEGTTLRVFIDGAVAMTVTVSATDVYDYIILGAAALAGATPLVGQIDELRVRWGSAIWNMAFTPPTEQYN